MSRRVRLVTGGPIEEWCSLCGFQERGFKHFGRHLSNAFQPIVDMLTGGSRSTQRDVARAR